MKRNLVYTLVALAVVGLFAAMTVRAPIGGGWEDALPASSFAVEIDGIVQTNFREVSGLGCVTEVVEFRDGNDPNTIRLLPGLTRCGPVVLKYGTTSSRELWDWYLDVIEGNPERKNAAVILLDPGRVERARWNLYNTFPVKWQGPDFDATRGTLAMETLTLAVERIERA